MNPMNHCFLTSEATATEMNNQTTSDFNVFDAEGHIGGRYLLTLQAKLQSSFKSRDLIGGNSIIQSSVFKFKIEQTEENCIAAVLKKSLSFEKFINKADVISLVIASDDDRRVFMDTS